MWSTQSNSESYIFFRTSLIGEGFITGKEKSNKRGREYEYRI